MNPPVPNTNGKLVLVRTTPIGRLIQGDCFKPSETDMQGNPLTVKTGPNAGQPRKEYFIGVAFTKGVTEVEAFRAETLAFERQAWPHLFLPDGRCTLPAGISNKWIDGDGFDSTGKAWSTREGFAGHWVYRMSSGYAPQVYAAGQYHPSQQLAPGSVQLGAFIRASVSIESNNNAQRPGLYVNLNMVELNGMGAPIIRGPDAAAAFSAPAGALPAGATPLTAGAAVPPAPPVAPPVAPPAAPHDPVAAALADGWAVHPSAPGWYYKGQETAEAPTLATRYPAPVAAPPPMPPAAPPAPPVAPAAPPAPYTGYAQPPGVPAPPAAAPPPPVVPTGPIMTAAANGVTYEAYRTSGWTDAQLIAGGLMLPAAGVH